MKNTWFRVCALLAWALCGQARAATFYLRAGAFTNAMPDGRDIPMWGFAQDSAFASMDGMLSVPGPRLTVPSSDTNLTLYLDNDLDHPVSLVIPGQIAVMVPVRHDGTVPEYDGRIRSFTHETPPGNAVPVAYVWPDVRAGTFLYHSGTHIAVQMQMGLYGCMTRDAAPGEAYAASPYDSEAVLLYSEIDPALHDAVASGGYGPAGAMTSTIGFQPTYFLVNGESFVHETPSIPAGAPGDRILLRFLNAGVQSYVPSLVGHYVSLIAEDGRPYAYPRSRYAVDLQAAKTKDALLVVSNTAAVAVYDRRLHLTNSGHSPAGMLSYLSVCSGTSPEDTDGDGLPDCWEWRFGGTATALAPLGDEDGDGASNSNEMVAGSSPIAAESYLHITELGWNSSQATVGFTPIVGNRTYFLMAETNLLSGMWTPVATGSTHLSTIQNLVDPNGAAPGGVKFYRVGVTMP